MSEPLPSFKDDVRALEHFARIKLIVADLDGTLVHPMSDHVSRMIRSLMGKLASRNQEVWVTIATGRALAGVRALLQELKLRPSIPIALYNGGLVLVPDRLTPLHLQTISQNALKLVLRAVRSMDASALAYQYYVPSQPFDQQPQGESVYGWGSDCPAMDINGLQVTSCDDDKDVISLCPVAILVQSERGTSAWQALHSQLAKIPGITLTSSSSLFIEIRPEHSNKAIAIRKIAESLGVSRDQVLAIGDNDNDAEMLAWAGIGVAVQGASGLALENSDFYCRHAVDHGVVELLRVLRQAKRFDSFFASANEVPIESHNA